MSARLQLEGQTFGRLYVVDMAYVKNKRTYWNCQCECGKQVVVMGKYLTNGDTKSCGCWNDESRARNGRNNKKHNSYEILEDDRVKVYFTNKVDEYFICDKSDLDKVLKHSWWLNNTGYVRTRLPDGTMILLHDYLLEFNAKDDSLFVIDHKDHNPRNNIRSNLRIVTRSENCLNRKNKYNKDEEKFRGVYKRGNSWVTTINIQNQCIPLGSYKTFEEAKQVRLQAEQKYCLGVIIDDDQDVT